MLPVACVVPGIVVARVARSIVVAGIGRIGSGIVVAGIRRIGRGIRLDVDDHSRINGNLACLGRARIGIVTLAS